MWKREGWSSLLRAFIALTASLHEEEPIFIRWCLIPKALKLHKNEVCRSLFMVFALFRITSQLKYMTHCVLLRGLLYGQSFKHCFIWKWNHVHVLSMSRLQQKPSAWAALENELECEKEVLHVRRKFLATCCSACAAAAGVMSAK